MLARKNTGETDMKTGAFLIAFLAFVTLTAAQEDYATWSGHKTVILNTSATGANVTGNVLNFPVLIRLGSSDSAVFAQAGTGGASLRFTKADNSTRLSHQIEQWDGAGRSAVVWVLADTVHGNRRDKYIRMHWGKTGAADSSSGTQVFRVAHGFRAVWHMNGTTATSNENDATVNGLAATQTGSPSNVTGVIGGARSFNGTSSYLSAAGSATTLNFPVNGTYSVSAWVNATQLLSHGSIISKGDNAYALKLRNAATEWQFFEYDGTAWNSATAQQTFPEAGTWLHFTGVQNQFEAKIYINGVLDNPFGMTVVSGGTGRVETLDLAIGAQSGTTFSRYFTGVIDEVRVHGVSRDSNWARLEYQNQRPAGQTLVSLVDTIPTAIAPPGRTETAAGFGMKPLGAGLLFEVPEHKAARKIIVSLSDMWGRTVWSHTAGNAAGTSRIIWNGRAPNGGLVSSGVYVARVVMLDAANKPLRSIERKIPLTR
jgi:hypothetical protein